MSIPPTDRRRSPARRIGDVGLGALALALSGLAAPAIASAHQLTGRFTSPIPLGAYLVGAALAVGVSFAIVFARGDGSPDQAPDPDGSPTTTGGTGSASTAATTAADRTVGVPRLLRRAIAVVGLLAWAWIVVQAVLLGGHSEGDVASLFLWTYGWVGLALVSAFIGPVWTWLDPFSSLHRLAAGVLSRLGLSGGAPAPYPDRLGRWPAVVGFAVVIWFELAIPAARSGQGLGIILVGYTVITLIAMAQFGREPWRHNGEVFSVWFGLIGRLAPLALPHRSDGAPTPDDPRAIARLRVRTVATGLLDEDHRPASLVMVALSVGGILYDGLSQTQIFFDAFGIPTIVEQSALLFGWLALVVTIALLVARIVGYPALTAGLIPIAIGYLIAHYLTFILFDSQRILLALDDPLGLGATHLLGLVEFEPGTTWLPGSVAWSLQLFAVIGGHVVGAWAGHAVYVRERVARERASTVRSRRDPRLREVPLALLMVGLTTLTLWSLGQAIVTQSEAPAAAIPAVVSR